MRLAPLAACIACVAFAPFAGAATIAAVTGPTYLAAGIGAGNGQQAQAMGFSTSTALAGVTVAAPISVLYQATPITAYLSRRIGPGTTAADVVAQRSLTVAANTSTPNDYQFTTTTFFTGLALTAGSYYLSLIETDGMNNAGVGYIFNGQQTVTLAPGATFLGTFGTNSQGGTFAPGFGGYQNNRSASLFAGDDSFTVTGTLLPEPTATFAAAGAVAFFFKRRR